MATRRDAGTELEYAADLINRVIDGIDGVRTAIHVCRGNWSRREDVLLSGSYEKLVSAFQAMKVNQFVLEYATPRAGEFAIVGQGLTNREIGLGVVNPRTEEAEAVAQIVQQVESALLFTKPDNLFLNPDCGFGTFSRRCINSEEVALLKLFSMVEAASYLRRKHK
ncbi:MAG: hypothetical protein OEM52_11850 [bacterium]|nr:hypothetical protein [bacterium]